MALSNLVSDKLEQYGGIDLKKNQQKFFSRAMMIAIGLHLILIFFYIGWSWFSREEDTSKIPHIHSIAELAPPPSTEHDEEMQPATPPPPSNVVKPNLGVPVPVPDAIAPQLTLPDLNQPAPVAQVVSNGPVTQTAAPDLHINAPVEEKDPSMDDFISVDQEPTETVKLENLVQYPEVARRSGLEGKVHLYALVGKDGRVDSVVILKSDYDIFRQAAIDAMKKERYTPARQNGEPLKVWVDRIINFTLH